MPEWPLASRPRLAAPHIFGDGISAARGFWADCGARLLDSLCVIVCAQWHVACHVDERYGPCDGSQCQYVIDDADGWWKQLFS